MIIDKVLEISKGIDTFVYDNSIGKIVNIAGITKEMWKMPLDVLGGLKLGSFIAFGVVAAAIVIIGTNPEISKKLSRFMENYPTASKIVIIGGFSVALILFLF